MDKLREFELEREKRMYNLMSFELFDLLDPKREMKVLHEDLKYLNEIKNLDTTPLYDSKNKKGAI